MLTWTWPVIQSRASVKNTKAALVFHRRLPLPLLPWTQMASPQLQTEKEKKNVFTVNFMTAEELNHMQSPQLLKDRL